MLDCSSIVRSVFSMVHWLLGTGAEEEQTLDTRQMMMMMEKAKNKSVEIIAMTLRWDRSKSENIKTVLHFLPHSCDRWTTTYQVQSSHSCSGALPRHVRLMLIQPIGLMYFYYDGKSNKEGLKKKVWKFPQRGGSQTCSTLFFSKRKGLFLTLP